jgi:CubicO group peptidase (beta-lactamase class C family)
MRKNKSATIDFSTRVDPGHVGMRKAQVDKIGELFDGMVTEKHWHPAAQLVILRHSQVVLDRIIGTGRDGKPIDHETPFYTFSVSKPFIGVCIHKLMEEGKIKLDERIETYWPEFGCHGKEEATIRHAMLHLAGIPAPHLYWQIPLWPNWKLVTKAVAGYKAVYPPGKVAHYHSLNYGFMLGEIVRRVTRVMPDEYFSKHFSEPLGLSNTWMRIPAKEIPRSPRLISYNKEHDLTVKIFDLKVMRTSVIPAASIHSNARELATFFQMLLNGGEYAGKRYLESDTIKKAVSSGYHGHEANENSIVNFGFGFQLGGEDVFLKDTQGKKVPFYGKGSSEKTFGHYGLGSCMVWADPDADIVVAFTTNGLWHSDVTHIRWNTINDAVWDAVS